MAIVSILVLNAMRNNSVALDPGPAGEVGKEAAEFFGHDTSKKKFTLRAYHTTVNESDILDVKVVTPDYHEYELLEI